MDAIEKCDDHLFGKWFLAWCKLDIYFFGDFLHAFIFLYQFLLLDKNRNNLNQVSENSNLPSFKELGQMLVTFMLACVAWVFFRADGMRIAYSYLYRMFTNFEFKMQFLSNERYNVELLILLMIFIMIEWLHKKFEHPFQGKWLYVKITIVILMILTLGVYSNEQDFIYFQF